MLREYIVLEKIIAIVASVAWVLGLELVRELYVVLVRLLEGIVIGNVIWISKYNRNQVEVPGY